MSRAHSYSHSRAHSPTFPSLYLRHSSLSNSSVASPTSQLILQPFFRFSYVIGSSLTSPGEPSMINMLMILIIITIINDYYMQLVNIDLPLVFCPYKRFLTIWIESFNARTATSWHSCWLTVNFLQNRTNSFVMVARLPTNKPMTDTSFKPYLC